MVDIAEVQAFFFRAMREGYAGSGQKTEVADMPGYKEIRFSEGDFLLVDRYCVAPNLVKSAGTTTIWFDGVPVWVMNYGGYYEEEAISILKRALSTAYQREEFFGGRGQFVFTNGGLLYTNHPRLNDFARFEGREEVFGTTGRTSLGFHDYWGMSLL